MTTIAAELSHPQESERSRSWTKFVLVVLLMATFLNYANRFAFTQNAAVIKTAFQTNEAGYGALAGQFGLGFALGGLLFGILADVVSVRILYPVVVVVWSIAGITSGLVTELWGLGVSRFVLGLFEAGHWPCALRTTQRIFKPHERTWGNSVLQSGASLGAVATPLLVLGLLRWDPDQWRMVFFIVGGLGLPWAVCWLLTISETDVRRPVIQTDETSRGPGEQQVLQEVPFWTLFVSRRWWLLLIIVVCINTLWHYVRVWMPLMLATDHGYSQEFVQSFSALYYLSTFFGSIASGLFTARLASAGWNVHRSRLLVFFLFGLLASLSIPAAFLPTGRLLLGTLLLVGFGSLGLFPIYYSLNQELSARNQGKVGGSLGFCTWTILSMVHPVIGRWVEADPGIRPWLFAGVGIGPMIAFAVLLLFWGRRPTSEHLNQHESA